MIDTGQLKKQILTSSFESLPNYLYEPLGNHVIFERGITFPASEKKAIREIGTIPCIRTANIQENLDISDLIYVSERFVKNNKKLIRSDDIFISMANSRELVGKSCMVSENTEQMTFGGFVTVARSIDVHQRYLYFYLKYLFISSKMLSIASQTTNIANISSKSLQSLSIPLPPLEEQKRIVAKIEELFAKIDEIDKAQKELKELAELAEKKVLDMAVRGELVEQDENDSSALELLTQIKIAKKNAGIKVLDSMHKQNESGVSIPKTWVETSLGECFYLKAGKAIKRSDISEHQDDDHQFTCYGGNGVRGYVSSPNRTGPCNLIGRQGALCGNINLTVSEPFFATEHAVVVEDFGFMNKAWEFIVLKSLNLNQYSTSVAQPGLSVNKINAVKINLPPIEEQDRISKQFSKIKSQLERIKN